MSTIICCQKSVRAMRGAVSKKHQKARRCE
jgi:hypothetical protein